VQLRLVMIIFLNVIKELNIENVDINSALLSLNIFYFHVLVFLQWKQKMLLNLHCGILQGCL
jgi:hypothetical protein